MKIIVRYTATTILFLGAMTSIYFLVNNLQPLKPALYSFALIVIVGLGLFVSVFIGHSLERHKRSLMTFTRWKYFTIIALSVITMFGILARLYLFFRFSYSPISDPLSFYDAGQKIASGQGMLNNAYSAFFPYLAAYNNILGFSMRFVSDPWLAVTLLNTVFDIGGAIIIYLLTRKLTTPKSHLPIIAFGVWLLNPLNIVQSVISLPLIVVNFFIITIIFLVYLIGQEAVKLKTKLTLILASLLGVTMGYGNCFRPVFIIAIIALLLLFIYVFITNERTSRLLILLGLSFLLVVSIFSGIQKLNLSFVTKETGIVAASNASGWSVYVGSNWENDGGWNQADQDKIVEICKNSLNNGDCQEKLQRAGIERYKSYGLTGTLSLLGRKLYKFSSGQYDTYNANQSLSYYANSRTAKIINIYINLFIAALFLLSAKFLYYSAKNVASKKEIVPITLFASILMLGFFFSSVLIEAAPRYAWVMYPIFVLFATLSLGLSRKPK